MSSDGAGRPSVLPVERLLGTMLVSGGPGGQLTVHKLSRVSEQGRAPGNILAENLILMNQLRGEAETGSHGPDLWQHCFFC